MIFEAVIILIFLIAGFRFSQLLKSQLSLKDVKFLNWLWVYHILFAIIYYGYTLNDGSSDSISYWNRAKLLDYKEAIFYLFNSKGTGVMYAINYFPSKVLGLSYFTGTIMYAFLGFIGIALYYVIVIKIIPYNVRVKGYLLFPTLFFMPNLHFWSGGIGKDTILFSCIAVFVYSLLKINNRILLLLSSLVLSYIVRPHITLFLLISSALAYLIASQISIARRVFLAVALIAAGLVILPNVMEYAKIEETTIDSFNKYSNTRATNLSEAHTGSSVDISSYSLPAKIFTFLYRPLFFDINGIPAILASFENLILLVLTFMVLRQRPVFTFRKAPLIIKSLFILLIIGTLVFSSSLGNVGIMIRMRNMFLPGLILYIMWSFSYQREQKINRATFLSKRKINQLQKQTAD